jgi:hypothetical protein
MTTTTDEVMAVLKDYDYFHRLLKIGVPKQALLPALRREEGLDEDGFDAFLRLARQHKAQEDAEHAERASHAHNATAQTVEELSAEDKRRKRAFTNELSTEQYFGLAFLRECFDQFDRDGDGFISVVEFVSAVQKTSNDLARISIQVFFCLFTNMIGLGLKG